MGMESYGMGYARGKLEIRLKKPLPANRSFEQIKNHYEIEKVIAAQLKQSTREERKTIYQTMYEELFQRVPDHPRLTCQMNKDLILALNRSKWRLVDQFINPSTVFTEFAPGDCRFAMEVSQRVKRTYGIDISDQRGQTTEVPDNFQLMIYDGYHLDFEKNSVDVVFSDQLIEHLHPEDAVHHFQLVKGILKKGGVYVFRTPHRFSGPHDISGYFSDEPEGFHLKEWTYSELANVLKDQNYSSWYGYWQVKGKYLQVPFPFFIFFEKILKSLPKPYRIFVSQHFFTGISMAAVK